MYIKNVKIFAEDGTFYPGEISIKDGKFEHILPLESAQDTKVENQAECIDGKACYAIPGMLDIHFHGSMGADFCDGTMEAIKTIGKYQASIGVTTMIPATLTLSTQELVEILSLATQYESDPYHADLVGINMEGPFISPDKKGAQNENFIQEINDESFLRLKEAAGGLLKYMAVAPEKDGAIDFVQKHKGTTNISVAHTNANYDQAKEVFNAGANHAVHLFNAMPAYTHREPGVVGAIFDSAHVTAEIICDGIHIHPAVVRNTMATIGDDRLIFISDSMRATGMPNGIYDLGGLEVEVNGNYATLVEGGALAGSATNLLECMKIAVKQMDIPLGSAIKACTMNPAKSAGVYDKYGSITEGKNANLLLLDEDLNIIQVIKDGVIIV